MNVVFSLMELKYYEYIDIARLSRVKCIVKLYLRDEIKKMSDQLELAISVNVAKDWM